MVALRTRKREMRGDGGNLYEKLAIGKVAHASQLIIPDKAGARPDVQCNNINKRSSQPNCWSHTPQFSYPLVSCTSFSASSQSLSSASTTQTSSHNIMLSRFILSLHAMIMSLHWVQHTQGTAYIEYSIHRVQHTPSTAYTEYSIHRVQHPPKIVYLPFVLMITSWPVNIASASGVHPSTINRHQPAHQDSLKVIRHCHIPMVAWQLADEYTLNTWRAIQWPPPGTCQMLLDSSPEVLVATRSITASKCMSQPAPLLATSLHHHDLQVHLQTHSIMVSTCISQLTLLWPPSVSPNSLNYGLQVYLQTCAFLATKCIIELARLLPPSSFEHQLHIHLETHSIMASECISVVAQMSVAGASWLALKHHQ